MALVKMMQRIAFLIMMYAIYVESIRNSGSRDNYASSNPLDDSAPSSFFPADTGSHMPETLTDARQSQPFRPSQLVDFTLSDASSADFTTTHNYPTYAAAAEYPSTAEKRYSPDSQFAFPTEPQQTSLSATHKYNFNYNANSQSNNPNAIPTQLQSTPILTYLDPYTNENHRYTPSPASSGQEYTVHSTMLVQNHRYKPNAPTYQRKEPTQQPTFGSRPSYASYAPQASDFLHKYDVLSPQYSPHPNAISNYERESPAEIASPTSPPRLSYASKDYPPPSYFQHSNQPTPQRQDFSTSSSSVAPNYANNNLGNYLQGGQYTPQQQQLQTPSGNYHSQRPPSYTSPQQSAAYPHYQPSRGGPPQQPRPPTYNNYYDYQLGEVPPIYGQQSGYRPQPPYRPVTQSAPQPSGLASLATLFSTTQQYAPQFTNLLLSGVGGTGGGGNNALGSLLGAFTGAGGGGASPARPMNMQLIKALENIARNDNLQCVPKVLCQMIAGQTQRGQLPTFATSPAITNFLAAFPASSPALIYGRAALLGISGGVRSCVQTYAQCPKNEDEILYYLNNHRGGFFKLFSEPEPEQEKPQQTTLGSSGSSSLFSLLSLLTGNPPPTTTTPRPTPRPTTASADITSGIGNFFSNVLSEYLGGVEYQRRRRRRSLDAVDFEKDIEAELVQETDAEDFHDEEDDDDTENAEQYDAVEGRILHKHIKAVDDRTLKFFPENENLVASQIRASFEDFNRSTASKKVKFPSIIAQREYEAAKLLEDARGSEHFEQLSDGSELQHTGQQVNFIDDYDGGGNEVHTKRGKQVRFQNENENQLGSHKKLATDVSGNGPRGGVMIFPDSNQALLRRGRILNRPSNAASHSDYVRSYEDTDRLVVSDSKRQRYYEATGSAQSGSNNYLSQSTTSGFNTLNRYGSPQHQSNSYSDSHKAPNHNYNNPSTNFVAHNRYSTLGGSTSRTTRRPYAFEDDKNIYVTDSKGNNEYYITPDGRKIYY